MAERKGIVYEFEEFIRRGNVVDLVVGFTVGAAFTTLVRSLVDDILMPPIGLLFGGLDFSNLFVTLRPGDPAGPYATLQAAQDAGAQTLRYGLFINSVITFLIIAIAVFFVVKLLNRLLRERTPGAEPEAASYPCPYCYSEIPRQAVRCPHCTSELTPA